MKTKWVIKQRWVVLLLAGVASTGPALAQVPQIISLVPLGAAPGSVPPTGPGLTITVNGTGFNSSSRVGWNGYFKSTIFISSTKLAIAITAEDTELPGTATVT